MPSRSAETRAPSTKAKTGAESAPRCTCAAWFGGQEAMCQRLGSRANACQTVRAWRSIVSASAHSCRQASRVSASSRRRRFARRDAGSAQVAASSATSTPSSSPSAASFSTRSAASLIACSSRPQRRRSEYFTCSDARGAVASVSDGQRVDVRSEELGSSIAGERKSSCAGISCAPSQNVFQRRWDSLPAC